MSDETGDCPTPEKAADEDKVLLPENMTLLTDAEREVLGNVADDARYRAMSYTERVVRGLLERLGGGK